ncbi:hypothetical protein [Albibacterium sp.]|uniref:hypothetical protein n=1 Tax=Albibacterium sp. TaxID=2952885 RepID=UPI002B7B8E6C|nr:hypothetical protein [Albibacterium sp.]HUH18095.1 hypothetical protein [Albibacterium sp.]
MKRSLVFKILIAFVFLSLPFSLVQTSMAKPAIEKYQQQDNKKNKGQKKPKNNKQEPNQPEIKTVPKARKQPRPTVVAKPKVKPKPIKVVRPNIRKP